MLVMNIVDKIQQSKLKICFYFPYHEVSGVPVLFFRMANQLAVSNNLIKIYVIDYEDGSIAKNLIINCNITLLPFVDGVTISPPVDSVLVMQSILPYSMRNELKILPNTKLFFWNLHPDCLIPTLIPLPYLRDIQNRNFDVYRLLANSVYSSLFKNIRKFVEKAIAKKSLFFMDQSNVDKTAKYLNLNISKIDFLPVPALESTIIKSNNLKNKEEINFTWVGRLCDFKSHILIYTIKKLSMLAFNEKIKIKYSIIGDGLFKSEIQKLAVKNEWFTVEMLGSMHPDNLDSYLLNNTDVLTGMGTSSLEGAKLGIPTILLDISYFPIQGDYKFRWLHHSINFDLAHDINQNDFAEGNSSLNEILYDLLNNYKETSIKSLEYFSQNHEMKGVLENFISKINECEMKFSDINPSLLNKSVVRKIYDKMRGIKRIYDN
jgi:hypothetical protein